MKEHAHQMIEQLDPCKLAVMTQPLELLTDPVSRSLASSLASAPVDDEPISAAEAAELDKAHASIQRGEGIPHQDILREYGIGT